MAPAIVTMDEAAAHLGLKSEAALQRAMKAALSGRSSFVIAHLLSTIQEFDQILVIDDRQVVQRCSHSGLLTSVGLYGDLHHNQYARHANPPGRPAVRRAPQQEPVHWSGRSA